MYPSNEALSVDMFCAYVKYTELRRRCQIDVPCPLNQVYRAIYSGSEVGEKWCQAHISALCITLAFLASEWYSKIVVIYPKLGLGLCLISANRFRRELPASHLIGAS